MLKSGLVEEGSCANTLLLAKVIVNSRQRCLMVKDLDTIMMSRCFRENGG